MLNSRISDENLCLFLIFQVFRKALRGGNSKNVKNLDFMTYSKVDSAPELF